MTPNIYLSKYSNDEVTELYTLGSIDYRYDSSFNLLIDTSGKMMFSSSITLPLVSTSFNSSLVETKYDVNFTELS